MTEHPILRRAHELHEQLIAWRRDFHIHPELSFQEERTARVVADTLDEMGIEVQRGVGKTGVVGYIGEGSPVIGIRADMDALPIEAANDVPYRSTNPGVMHACGHDAHTAILLGVAQILNEMPDRPPGQIRLLFQPSEEAADDDNKSGAIRMIEDGALSGVNRTIALHVASELPAGGVEIIPEYMTAAEDSFHFTIYGTGGHGAMPHLGTDPTFMLAQLINAIQGIRSRRIDPTKSATISIGYIHGGTATNVIPSEIKMGGTIRTYDDEIRIQIKEEMQQALQVVRALGGEAKVELVPGYPSTYNDPAVAELIKQTTRDLLGEDKLLDPQPMMGAEDFSYMSREAPGAMFFLGAALDDKERPHHTPVFDISEDALPIGAAMLAECTIRLLQQEKKA